MLLRLVSSLQQVRSQRVPVPAAKRHDPAPASLVRPLEAPFDFDFS
jgi:hypothetical protein